MHRYYEPGYYWYRKDKEVPWQVVELKRSNATAAVTMLFVGTASSQTGLGSSMGDLRGELVGPIKGPDAHKVVPISK